MAARLLSLIMPAYKQEKTIVRDVKNIEKILGSLPIRHETIVVVDGRVDKTAQKLSKVKNVNLKVIDYEDNKGKGFAIKLGVKEANGDIIGFIDAGMDLDPSEISLMIDIMDWNNADIVVGSKLHPDSKVNYPFNRKVLSWGYRTIVRLLFHFNVKDTQVGLKIFKKNVAKKVFSKIIVKRFAFDVEVLAVAQKFGYTKIYEAPVKLKFRPGSITSAKFIQIAALTLIDTAAVFYRMNVLHYYDKK